VTDDVSAGNFDDASTYACDVRLNNQVGNRLSLKLKDDLTVHALASGLETKPPPKLSCLIASRSRGAVRLRQ
jgi:hypothetical protein